MIPPPPPIELDAKPATEKGAGGRAEEPRGRAEEPRIEAEMFHGMVLDMGSARGVPA